MSDILGQRFDKLVVKKRQGSNSRKEALWLCDCDCGNNCVVKSRNLKIGKVKSCGCLKTGPKRIDDVSETSVNNIKITSYSHQDKDRSSVYNYECSCGNTGRVRKSQLKKIISCKECAFKRKIKNYEDIGAWYFNCLKCAAKKRKIEFNLNIEDLWECYLKQNRKCIYTNRDISLEKSIKNRYLQTASLDRIDSSVGYEKNNIQWVYRDINYMKGSISHLDFLKFCKEIYNNCCKGD